MYYLQSRYYDPAIGRFLNADSLINLDDSLGLNTFAYCSNNPTIMIDQNGKDGQTVDLGKGWHYRIDKAINKTRRHIHIWKEGGKSYAQNDDGSPHDKGKNDQGKLPKWVQNAVKEKAGWDYNGNRKSFFQQTECKCTEVGISYSFADGTSAYENYSFGVQYNFTITHFESVYYNNIKSSTTVNTTIPKPFLPLLPPIYFPTFSFGFSWGLAPIPLLF